MSYKYIISYYHFIFRLSLNHPVNSSPFTLNSRRSTPNILSPFNTLSPMTAIRLIFCPSYF